MRFLHVCSRGMKLGVSGLVLGVALAGGPGTSQQKSGNPIPNPVPSATQTDPFGTNDKVRIDRPPFQDPEGRNAKLREEERQKRLVNDTDKLLELATALHAEVAKTDRHILSVDVVKRADEIERLAHNVKERMKG